MFVKLKKDIIVYMQLMVEINVMKFVVTVSCLDHFHVMMVISWKMMVVINSVKLKNVGLVMDFLQQLAQ